MQTTLRQVGNILWFLTTGLAMGFAWLAVALFAFATVIGRPWARSSFDIALYAFFPFGKAAIPREYLPGQRDLRTGPYGAIGNIIWFVVAGFWLALGHALSALLCFGTIIGIPFALQHLKLMQITAFPIGFAIVSVEEAEAILGMSARVALDRPNARA